MTSSVDSELRRIYRCFQTEPSPLVAAEAITVNLLTSQELPLRLAALQVFFHNIRHFAQAQTILDQLLCDQEEEIRLGAASTIALGLSRVLSPAEVFTHYRDWDPVKFPEVHQTLPGLFRLHKDWFQENHVAHEYLWTIFSNPRLQSEIREAALDAMCRLLPYQNPLTKQAIAAALEDDDPWIRAFGRELFNDFLLKDRVVKNAAESEH